MQRRNLRLTALRAFESAARHGGLTKAAKELGVTHAAISQQIKLLESVHGIRLFKRTSQGIELTPEGRTLLPTLTECLDRIGAALDGLTAPSSKTRLTVTTTTTFASRWLIPRLNRWDRSPGQPDIHVLPTLDILDLNGGDADVAIRCGVPNWPGDLVCERLLSVTMTPVCSPVTLRRGPKLRTPENVLAHTLIHADVEFEDSGYEWRTWLSANGINRVAKAAKISFHDPGLAMEAAASGIGIAIGYIELIYSDIVTGRLVCPFDKAIATHPYSYYLVYPRGSMQEPSIQAFRGWITQEIHRTMNETASARIGQELSPEVATSPL